MDIKKAFDEIGEELDKVVYEIWDKIQFKGNIEINSGFLVFNMEYVGVDETEDIELYIREFARYINLKYNSFVFNNFHYIKTVSGIRVSVDIIDGALSKIGEEQLCYNFEKIYNERPKKETK